MGSRGIAAKIKLNQYMSQDSYNINPNLAQDVFTIDLIMIQILKPLNNSELLSCRLINSTFEDFATQILRSRNSLFVEFSYNWDKRSLAYVSTKNCKTTQGQRIQNHGKNIDNRYRSHSLDDFTALLKNKKSKLITLNFPSKSFKFRGGPVNDKCFQKFLKISGCLIEEFYFELNCANDWDPLAKFQKGCGCIKFSNGLRNLLSDCAPNLQVLELETGFSKAQAGGKYFPNDCYFNAGRFQINFPSLKKLTLGKNVSSNVFRDIFKTSQELQSVYLDNEKHVEYAITKNRFDLIQAFTFCPSKVNIEFFEQHFLKQQVLKSSLKSIKIVFCGLSSIQQVKSRISQVTQDILEASANTLEEIEFSSPLGLLCENSSAKSENFKFPPLPHVTCLKISTQQIQSYLDRNSGAGVHVPDSLYSIKNFFPPTSSFKLKSTFPALKTFKFDFQGIRENSTWDEFFHLTEPVLTVKSLIFSKATFLPSNSLTNCYNLFPNVECLTIRTQRLSIYHAALNGLWNFGKLKQLKLDIHLEWGGNAFPALDAAFTGFDLRTCIEFRKCHFENGIDAETITECRNNPSILQLQDLENLQITIVDRRKLPGSRLYEHQRIMSHVTGDYGFKMCPKLKVELDFYVKCEVNLKKIQENLRPMLRYLHLTSLPREADD